jgi:hypothetical protein
MQDMQTETLKEVRPPCMATSDTKMFFLNSPSGKDLIFSKDIFLWEISVPKEF